MLVREHLLKKYPDKPVCLSGRKTAVICSAIMPQFVWVAVGGKTHSETRWSPLCRTIVAFPDVDGTRLG
jgi:hypothetical protein